MTPRAATLLIALGLAATGADAGATPDSTTETAAVDARGQADDDRAATAYAAREQAADEQLAYRGSQGAQYTQAFTFGVVVSALAVIAVVVILVVVL
jgi:hypothetical protein